MVPVIQRFVKAHQITKVTVVADAGMMSESNLKAVEEAGWDFIVGGRMAVIPEVIKEWLNTHPGQEPYDGLVLTASVAMGGGSGLRPRTVFYQWRSGRAKRTLHGIDLQISKAEKAVAGGGSVKRNRFVSITGAVKSIDRVLETKARLLAGWKSYVTNLDADAEFVIGAYHRLWHVEHSFRMSKHDLRARPIFHSKRESIDAHLTIVMAALAISHWIEQTTNWSIKQFVTTLRCYRQITLTINGQPVQAEQPLPDEAAAIIAMLRRQVGH